jgi:hypothetical protein
MRRLIRVVLAVAVLAGSAAPCLAQETGPEDTRLKGRGWGRGVAAAWNAMDKPTRRVVVIGLCVVIVGAVGYGIHRFVRETREAVAPRVRQPWEVG